MEDSLDLRPNGGWQAGTEGEDLPIAANLDSIIESFPTYWVGPVVGSHNGHNRRLWRCRACHSCWSPGRGLPYVRGEGCFAFMTAVAASAIVISEEQEIESEEKAILLGMNELKVRLDRIEATLLLPVVDRTSPQFKVPASGTPRGHQRSINRLILRLLRPT